MTREETEHKLLARLKQIHQKTNNLGGLSGMTDAKLQNLEVMLKKALKHIKTLRGK